MRTLIALSLIAIAGRARAQTDSTRLVQLNRGYVDAYIHCASGVITAITPVRGR